MIITNANRKEALASIAKSHRRTLPPRDSRGRFIKVTTCDYCEGEGVTTRQGFGYVGMVERFRTCPKCGGTGQI